MTPSNNVASSSSRSSSPSSLYSSFFFFVMMVVIGQLLLLVFLPSVAEGRNVLVWGGSSQVTASGVSYALPFPASMRRGVELAFAAANGRTDKMGALTRYNLTTLWFDDNGNASLALGYSLDLVLNYDETQFFGFLPASDYDTAGGTAAFQVLESLGVTSIPFVGPWTAFPPLETYHSWVFSPLPSNFISMTYSFLKFLATQKLLSRFSLLYPSPAALGGVDLKASVDNSLSYFGLRQVSYYALPSLYNVDQNTIDLAVVNISLGNPQAVMVIGDYLSADFVKAAKAVLDPSVIYILEEANVANISQEFTTNEERENVYIVFAEPLLSDTSLPVVNEFWNDLAQYDATWTDLVPPAALNGYLTGRWIASVLETIRPGSEVNRTMFMNAVYQTPIINIGGITFGPFYSDCTRTGCQACCNAGARTIYLVQFPNGTLEYVPNAALSWQSCYPQPSDVELPFKFGLSASLTGSDGSSGTAMLQGLASTFNGINAEGNYNGIPLVLLAYDDLSDPTKYAATNEEQLVKLDAVLAFTGLIGYESISAALNFTSVPVIGFVSGSPSIQLTFNPSLVSIGATSYEEIAGALDFFLRGQQFPTPLQIGIFYENSEDGRLTEEGLASALALHQIELGASLMEGAFTDIPPTNVDLWMIYNPQGDLVVPFIQSLSSQVTVCILSSLDPDTLAANLSTVLLSSPSSSKRTEWLDLSSIYFTQSLPNPNPSTHDNNSTTSQLISNYQATLAALDDSLKPTYNSLTGYVTAKLLAALISNVKGQVTSASLLASLYASGVVQIDDLSLGVYYQDCQTTGIPCCNIGTRNIYLVTANDNGTWSTQHNFNYSQCRVTFTAASTGGGGLSSVEVALITILPITLAVALLMLGLSACITLLAMGYMRGKRERQQWEIDYEELELGELLGQGGFGEVYKAQWRGTEVAVKILPGGMHDREQTDAFREETKVMSQLRHPNVVLFMGSCSSPTACIVMEFMSLGSLYQLLHNELVVEIPFALRLKMIYQAAKGMHFLHSSGIVHRDLKSLNLLLDNKWNLKVADFGLTRFKNNVLKKEAHAFACSIPWTAPEVLEEQDNIDYSLADVYSFGVILWEVLTRRDPYEGLSSAQIAVRVIRDDMRPTMDYVGDSDQQYLELMQNCWLRDSIGRPVFLDIMNTIQSIGNMHNVESFNKTSNSSSSSISGGVGSRSVDQSCFSSISKSGSDVLRTSKKDKFYVKNGARCDVSFVVCDLARFNEVWQNEPVVAEKSVEIYWHLAKEIGAKFEAYVFSSPGHHSGGTIMLSFANPVQAATFAIELQRRVKTTSWPLPVLNLISRVSIHYHDGNIDTHSPNDQLNATYPEDTYQEALRLNIRCPASSVLCSGAFKNAFYRCKNDSRWKTEELKDFDLISVEGHDFFILSDDCSCTQHDGWSPFDFDSREHVDTEELAICSSNRCPWMVDSKDIETQEILGEGNYGRVNRATYKGMAVAVKRLFNSKLDDTGMRKMRKEAAILSGLIHPNVVQLIGLSIDVGNLLLVMELAERGSLSGILRNASIKLSWQRKLSMLRDAANGILFLHQQGILHRDIKSSNLLVDENWNVKVGDFGFATAKQENCTLTRCGTPAWTAPEILSSSSSSIVPGGATYDEKADIYSFGIVMWELLTRKKPYSNSSPVAVAQDVLNGVRPPIPDDANIEYKKLMKKCWSASPAKRPSIERILTYCNSVLALTEV